MDPDEAKLLANIRQADTDDLLDRVTAYRGGIEPAAIDLIEQELHRRGITQSTIAEHQESYEREGLVDDGGVCKMCSYCRKPAVREGWGWHKVMGALPVFPRWMRYCREHARKATTTTSAGRPHRPS